MTWWLRLFWGLPARPEDVEEVHRSVPELLRPDFTPKGPIGFPYWPSPPFGELTVDDLKRWIGASDAATAKRAASAEDCPAENCPLRSRPHPECIEGDLAVLRLMFAGGAHKPPKDEFIDLVRKVHRGQKIREVILTDPYIYADVSEGGETGGFDTLIDYLKALGLTSESEFALNLNPSPLKASEESRGFLERKVKQAFPKARLGTFEAGHRFHDRFYLVRDQSGALSGVFGPSMNGLGAGAVVLMGELERTRTLERLASLV